MAEEQDKGYRLLFSFKRMVAELIRHFVGGGWLDRLDFETLEKVSEPDVSPELVRREKDLLWRLKFRPPGGEPGPGDWFYLHLEFEGRPKRFMALRVAEYKLILYQDLVRRRIFTSSGKLPQVLSMVLYSGEGRWRMATSLPELVERLPDAPEGSDLWGFRVIAEQRYTPEQLDAAASPVAELFRLEQCREVEEVPAVAARLSELLSDPQDEELREAFAVFINRRVLRRLVPPGMEVPQITNLKELLPMLEQRVDSWTRGWEQRGWEKGLREGREEGRQEGRQEGEARLLLRQVELKFGPLPVWVRERVEAATGDELLSWGERLLTAKGLEELFGA